MKKILVFLLCICTLACFQSNFLVASVTQLELSITDQLKDIDYVFCVDGGGTKTALQILDSKGNPLSLHRNGRQSFLLQGDCSNVVVVGKNEVKDVFKSLFQNLRVGENREKVEALLSRSLFIGGFAGAGRKEAKEALENIIHDLGFKPERVLIYTDAGLATELLGENGAILIAGTGSICYTKEQGMLGRFGGLGYRIGDDGSGYDIGLRAIKATIQEEFEYGEHTSLTPLIKELFNISRSSELVMSINGNQVKPGKIASVAPLVFQEAWKGDRIAFQIVEKAAHELGDLLAKAVDSSEIKHCLTYLIGGLFQNKNSDQFIKQICHSPLMQQLKKSERPLLVNLSEKMIPTLVVQEKLKLAQGDEYRNLETLPIGDEFLKGESKTDFNKEFVTTELSHPESKELSHIFFKDHLQGLKVIQKLDYSVIDGATTFVDNEFEKVALKMIKKVKNGGRVFFVGSGSSGRLCVDLSAKWREFWKKQDPGSPYKNAVVAIMPGGARTFVKLEGELEDSENSGYDALKDKNITSKDIVILVSASGTARFNVGAAKYARSTRADCYYFFNSKTIPKRTTDLFNKEGVKPICLDIGPQTISGSTGLQAASLGTLSWGLILNEVLLNLTGEITSVEKKRPLLTISQLEKSWDQVSSKLEAIRDIVDLQIEIFSHENSNFWKAYDETYQGYVTFLSSEDCFREILVDSTSTTINFSSNPPRSISEMGKKKAEYRAYMVGDYANVDCWNKLIGRNLVENEFKETSEMLISMKGKGYGEYSSRTVSAKNLIVGVFSSSLEQKKVLSLALELSKAKARGLKTVMIALEEEGLPIDSAILSYLNENDVGVIIYGIPKDPLGLTKTLTLKQILNLISNGAMIGMNKVYGNVMIDLSPSNSKLVDRSIRIIKQILDDHAIETSYSYELLYSYVVRALKYKWLAENQLGKHVPSPSKLVLTMLKKSCDVEKAVSLLKINNENIELIMSEI
ncbi:MAG: N-acetylmuramic acid 6-phosphate etherase [Chlamydiae bacterium]|nr:N-acetylmuramic acid 6-phosphate etherase [Chlamydiota bacterium]